MKPARIIVMIAMYMFEKEEPTITKEHYTCESCGYKWTERRQD